ncbi:MAG TPA: hypothetical protein PLD62_11795, partial [Candidatus Cloacimonadota bacterium]|nr:hypothetical protein [Candidatus Cloacimonadota bacterium]
MKIKGILLALLTFPLILTAQAQWQDNGMPVRIADNIRWSEASVNLSDGSVVVVWQDSRDESLQNYAQKFDTAGNKLWGDAGINISHANDAISTPKIAAGSDDSVFALWHYHDPDYINHYLVLQKFSASGELLWSDTGISFIVDDFQYGTSLIPDENGGVYCCWADNDYNRAILLLCDGTIAPGWDEAGTILAAADYYYVDSFIQIDGDLVFAYLNSDTIYIQKFNADGQAQWGNEGYLIATSVGSNSNLTAVKSSDGFWIGWKTHINSNYSLNLYRFWEDGTSYWNDPIQIISVSGYYIYEVAFVGDQDDGFYIGWRSSEEDVIRIAKI